MTTPSTTPAPPAGPELRRPLPLHVPSRGEGEVPGGHGERPSSEPRLKTMIDLFLEEQAATTAVQRFAQRHADAGGHLQRRWYADLLPATPPAPGQQYAFSVDLDACSGCKACVTACGALNGLEPGEAWRGVGQLVGVDHRPVSQSVTTACHHCVDPGCLNGCPADAYTKDPVTGVVIHLDDQCIGCRYCTLTCPYEVPQYSGDLGIVRKCDLCHDRLAEGEAPACVQACPTSAISIAVVDVDDFAPGRDFPFASPSAATTGPTTTFTSSRDLRDGVEAADLRAVRPAHAHLPLTFMLVVTQVAVGGFGVLTALGATGVLTGRAADGGVLATLVLALVALVGSVAHLGRPHLAWRAVLGLGHSWLSREIVAFGAFAGLGIAAGAAQLELLPLPTAVVAWLATAAGVFGVVASSLVYAVTGRRLWRLGRTLPRFVATSLAGGGVLAVVVVAVANAATPAATFGPSGAALLAEARPAAAVAALALVLGLVLDLTLARQARRGVGDALGRTGLLLVGPLRGALQARVLLGMVAIGALAVAVAPGTGGGPSLAFGVMAFGATVGADLVERWWFFTAEADTRMPGGRA